MTGILAARGLARDGAGLLPDDAVLALATSMEGHPDNVAACLHGGLTISWTPRQAASLDGGPAPAAPPGPRVVRLPVLEEIRPVVFVAEESLSTDTARGALPAAVPHRDAAANAARAALLVAALTRVPDVLFDATEDFLHQPYRAGGHAAHRGPGRPPARGRGGRGGLRGRPLRARPHRACRAWLA